MSTTIDDWADFFPPTSEGARPDQEKAINFILDRVKEGITNVFLEAPTGSGKSFLAWTVAQYCAAEMRWRTRILVPNLYLETQYVTDFSHLGMLRLESARHYDCPEYRTCDVGRGNEMVMAPQPESNDSKNGDNLDESEAAPESNDSPEEAEPRVQQRAQANKTWYALTAAQGCGRSVRNMHDIAPSYILDAKSNWWFRANQNLFPPYFHDALAAAKRHPSGVHLKP